MIIKPRLKRELITAVTLWFIFGVALIVFVCKHEFYYYMASGIGALFSILWIGDIHDRMNK